MVEIKEWKSFIIIFVLLVCQLTGTAVLAESSTYPKLTAETAVLMDATTGQVLFEKEMHKRKYPASITKIMTGMLALERGNLANSLTMSHEAVFSIGRNSSHIALDVEEELTLEQALYAIAIASANDAANGIAEHIGGSLEGFAWLMNEKAIQCGALSTNFVNAHGLPDENHYTTAYDMAKITMEAINTPKFVKIFGEARYQMPPTNKQEETRYFRSKNYLINGRHEYEGIICGKTGWTSQASHTLITAAKQEDRSLIVVVMNNQSANHNRDDTIELLDYGFQDFLDIKIDVADLKTIIREQNFNNEEDVNINIKSEDDLVRLLHKNLSVNDLETSYEFPESNDDETVQIIVLLNVKKPNNFMYSDLGSIFIEAEVSSEHNSEAAIITNDDSKDIKNYFLGDLTLLWLCVIAVFVKRKSIRKRNNVVFRNY